MNEIIKKIEVDVARANTFQAIVAKQGDKASRFLEVTLLNEGVKIAVEQGYTITLNAERSDKQAKAFPGEVNADGTVKVPLPAWVLEIDGQATCSISVIDGDVRLTSMSFSVNVQHGEFTNEDITDGDSVSIVAIYAEAAANELARKENETARQSNETTRQVAEEQRIGAEQARNNAEIERQASFEELLVSSENATQNANNAAQQASSAVLAGGVIPIYNEDENKHYTYQIIVRNGCPILSYVEATTTTEDE